MVSRPEPRPLLSQVMRPCTLPAARRGADSAWPVHAGLAWPGRFGIFCLGSSDLQQSRALSLFGGEWFPLGGAGGKEAFTNTASCVGWPGGD